jgi:hypothetical protein
MDKKPASDRSRGNANNGNDAPRYLNANNGVSNTNRNNAGSDQEDINLKITLLIRVLERQINKRQSVYFYVNRLRYVVTLMRYFLCLACIF